MASTPWRLDVDQWPGPNRKRWNITRDTVVPSPDGRFACVIYSIDELRLNTEAGLLTLLGAPPEAPRLLFQPPGFTCLDFVSPSAQWLAGSRYVAVTAYRYDSLRNRVDRLALTVLDTTTSTWAVFDVSPQLAGARIVEDGDDWVLGPAHGAEAVRIVPATLTWKPWGS